MCLWTILMGNQIVGEYVLLLSFKWVLSYHKSSNQLVAGYFACKIILHAICKYFEWKGVKLGRVWNFTSNFYELFANSNSMYV